MAEQRFELDITPNLGMNTAVNAAQLPQGAHRLAMNACMKSIGTIGKRPGSAPVTDNSVSSNLGYITAYKVSPSDTEPVLLAADGTTLYKYTPNTLTAQNMTNAFVANRVFGAAFTDAFDNSRLLLTDGGNLKEYNGAEVKNVTPAANDPDPAPPNDLTAINGKGPRYIWVHTGHVFLSAGTDLVWYSKRYNYNYFPSVQYFRFVRENDYITGPGITFANLCLIPMRRGWGVITGEVFNDGAVSNGFSANQYLNTANGSIAERGVTKITYPNGLQTIAYLSDDGVHEIYDTGFEGDGVRQYSTRSLMREKIDFAKYGFTEGELRAAVAVFDGAHSRLIVSISRDNTHYAFVLDTRNGEWYVWTFPLKVTAMGMFDEQLYFANTGGRLNRFEETLTSDWHDRGKTNGSPVDMTIATGLINLEFTGEQSYLHYFLVESAMWGVKSSLDITIVYGAGAMQLDQTIRNEVFVWDVTAWAQGQWANVHYTDSLNNAKRKVIHKKAKYFQIILRNNRDEPVTILRYKLEGTVTGIGG